MELNEVPGTPRYLGALGSQLHQRRSPKVEGDRTYSLPLETLPELDPAHSLDDLLELQALLEDRGVKTKNTRIDRYIAYYLCKDTTTGDGDAASMFKNSGDPRFRSPLDWQLYVLREVHELAWILRGLRRHVPRGVDDKLKVLVGGRDFAALDADSRSRDAQFELRIASYFCQAGCEVDLSGVVDVIASTDHEAFYVECKRIASDGQLAKRLSKGRKQLQLIPQANGPRTVFGCIAADVTKVAFPHNGLVVGRTSEHSKDVIQGKLIGIAKGLSGDSLFANCRNLHWVWMQIHIPAMILQPTQTATRFSSYHIPRDVWRPKLTRAAAAFRCIFESVSERQDERQTPARKLRLRSNPLTVPAGTEFGADELLVRKLLEGNALNTVTDEEVVGELQLEGQSYRFSVYEFKLLPSTLVQDLRMVFLEDPVRARLQLLLELYLRRHPYDEAHEHEA